MITEDLATLDILTEDVILNELYERLQRGEYHTFVGDVLLILNPNEEHDIYDAYVSLECQIINDLHGNNSREDFILDLSIHGKAIRSKTRFSREIIVESSIVK